MIKVGLLSRIDSLLLGYIIRELSLERIPIDAVLMDSKTMGEKGRRIQEERTGGKMPQLSLHEFEALRIPFYFVGSHCSEATVDLVKALNLDLLINAGTPRILTSGILRAPRIGVVSCHPGLLPQFRGCTCVEWAVYLDEQVGNTVHYVREGIDDGPVILQEGLTFAKDDTYTDVRVKVYRHACRLLARAARKVAGGDLSHRDAQGEDQGQYYKVIDDEKLSMVIGKLAKGQYRFQQ